MNKTDLIQIIADENHVSKAGAERMLLSTLGAIKDALAAGERVQLVGFGSFEVKRRKGHTGRNPRTREPMEIAATNRPVFNASKDLKEMLNP